MSKIITTAEAPAAIGPYSQAIVSQGFVFTSGQIPLNPKTGEIVGNTIREQADQALKNLAAVIAAAGSDETHVIKTTCFLADMSDFSAFNERYAESFPACPARSCVAVKSLPKGVLVEVEAVAELIV